MKTISFSVVKILPHLLDRTKDQTIRPAWYYPKSWAGMMASAGTKMLDKAAYLKVDEEVKLYWKQRGKASVFCKCHGKAVAIKREFNRLHYCTVELKALDKDIDIFGKVLGTGKMTEVFEIRMEKKNNSYFLECKGQWFGISDTFVKALAKKDGFDAAKEMFEKFDEMYDLSIPKRFYVYRWRWNK